MVDEQSRRGVARHQIVGEALAWLGTFVVLAVTPAAALGADRGPWERFVRASFVTSWFLGFACIAASAFLGILVLRVMQRIEAHMERYAEESVKTRQSIEKLADGIDRAMERRA